MCSNNRCREKLKQVREFVSKDSIVAIATPPGEGAIGIVRLSGPEAKTSAQKFFIPRRNLKELPTFRPTLGDFVTKGNQKIDQVLLIYYPAPRSYTGEDLVEIHAHGNPVVLRQIVQTFLQTGLRLAEPGEFTKRAFLNGKMDLTQAEAVANLIAAKTDLAAQASLAQLEGSLSRQVETLRQRIVDMFVYVEAAIDYPDEDLELLSQGQLEERAKALIDQMAQIRKGAQSGKLLRDGVSAVIVGKPNVGKSSLLNALLNEERAIVTPIPGTTRDIVSEFVNLEGLPVKFVDTAGIRETGEVVEQEGVRRSVKSLEQADVVLFVCDGASGITEEDQEILERVKNKKTLYVVNKSDLPSKDFNGHLTSPLFVSAKERTGLDDLRRAVVEQVGNGFKSQENYLVTLRHVEAMRRAEEALQKAQATLVQKLSGEFVAVDLRAALDELGEIVGQTTTDDILDKIFSTFCIGK